MNDSDEEKHRSIEGHIAMIRNMLSLLNIMRKNSQILLKSILFNSKISQCP